MSEERVLNDHEKAFYLSIALACVGDLRTQEKGDTQKSRVRAKKLRAMEGDLVKLTDLYLPKDGFAPDDLKKAGMVADRINEYIKGLFETAEETSEAA